MKFKSIIIKNFRSFEEIQIKLDNKNVFFGLNDVGKTNFLYALRFVLDKNIRRYELTETDFFNRNTNKPIEIILEIDIDEEENNPNQDNAKLRAKLRGAIGSKDKSIFMKFIAHYNNKEALVEISMYWGGKLNNLVEIKNKGYSFESDSVFNLVYIDSYIEIKKLFKSNMTALIERQGDDDSKIYDNIKQSVNYINQNISSLSGVKKLSDKLSQEYAFYYDDNLTIEVKSELEINNVYSNMVPYIKSDKVDALYPTAGEGRKKLLAYSVFRVLADNASEQKINILLLEEPENNLHKSLQIALSNVLFSDQRFKYIFLTTHSPYILYEMNNINLIRIYSGRGIIGKSTLYNVPKIYSKYKKMLNRNLSEAIFSSTTFLVEGPSEFYLFSKVLEVVCNNYESKGIYILPVNGIAFKKYKDVLEALNIKIVIRTDNDVRTKRVAIPSLLGFSRCNKLIGEDKLPTEAQVRDDKRSKRKLYREYKDVIDQIKIKNGVYLSRVDLENDLDEFMHDRLQVVLGKDKPVAYLQKSKLINMVELVDKLNDEDCYKIYNHENFEELKDVVGNAI